MTAARKTANDIIAKISAARNVPEMKSALGLITEVDSLNELSDQPGVYTDRRVLIAIDDSGANYAIDLSAMLDYKTELLVREAREADVRVGRPRIGDKIQIRLASDQIERIDREASVTGVNRSSLIRQYVYIGLNNRITAGHIRQLLELAKVDPLNAVLVDGPNGIEAMISDGTNVSSWGTPIEQDPRPWVLGGIYDLIRSVFPYGDPDWLAAGEITREDADRVMAEVERLDCDPRMLAAIWNADSQISRNIYGG